MRISTTRKSLKVATTVIPVEPTKTETIDSSTKTIWGLDKSLMLDLHHRPVR